MFGQSFVRGLSGPRPRSSAPRVVLYSHDTFGLGHLRRSKAIAKALVDAIPGLSALILTGSPVAGRFAFPEGVDHVRLPGVVKLPDGDYVSQNLGLAIDETTGLRAALIEAAVAQFDPDLVIVDKEPAGFRGEMLRALKKLRERRRARVVLGVRDVLDAPHLLEPEWRRKGALAATETFYDELWVYGLKDIYDPLSGLALSKRIRKCTHFTGYLRRAAWTEGYQPPFEPPYVVITAGGGGDGEALVDWALAAYERDTTLPPAALVYGPFLNGDFRARCDARVEALGGRVIGLSFVGHMEALMARSSGVVAMGGYNTFCEILSFDRPAAIAPRVAPRLEQYIRASAAERLGLVRMLDRARDGDGPEVMAAAIRAFATQPAPSASSIPGVLDGFPRIVERARALLGATEAAPTGRTDPRAAAV